MNGFAKRTEMKKKNILDTSFRLFSEHGLQKVSIQQIAKHAEVSQVTIYNYFGSKQQLLIDSIKHYAFQQLDEMESILYDKTIVFDKKIQMLMSLKQEDMQHFHIEFIRSVMFDQPEIHAFMEQFNETYSKPFFTEFLKQGKAEGFIRDDITVDTLMFYINMYSEASLRHLNESYDHEQLQHFYEQVMHLFFYGIAGTD
ncbi:TetR/AcrR family transcriptional regulator [Pontibacillus litoralis]|uniref:HTH tetR-type domain-containing protein n=1 Tax=Pontibacillus litoralis JSM 072002 TaxID=1385512 RepID=A0A0A5G8A5_9BACI|nr:TetR/AcrR family transcriptional regulator [Pontibacillus litoralis]KGX87403.1 hypothetical protein N784_15740 [Pontibacillus litoralis JSM 072002]